MFFSVITKNSNWEILTKNLVIFKDKMEWRIKNFNICGVHRKIKFKGAGGGVTTNHYIGGLGQFADLGGLVKKEGVDTLMHTMTNDFGESGLVG